MVKNAIKETIKKSYAKIAKDNANNSCCGTSTCCAPDDSGILMKEEYTEISGYQKEADLALGCGIPTEIAQIKTGDTVIDLGSGAGNDVFIAREIVGEEGRVIGIDFTPEMVIRALKNNQKLGFQNVDFHLGEIEDMAVVPNDTADVVISNCVMNLVLNKEKAFEEVFRVLKVGGHFSIADIVHVGELPLPVLEAAELHAGCVAGASEKGKYLSIIQSAGFKNIQVKKERLIDLPDDLLVKYLEPAELAAFRKSKSGIYSITVYAEKLEEGACCNPSADTCCDA